MYNGGKEPKTFIMKGAHYGRIKIYYGEVCCIGGGDLISVPAQQWLDGKFDREAFISAIKQADRECGSCGCEMDPLYKRALELI